MRQTPPPRRRRRPPFRWGLFVGLPLLLAVLVWVFNSVKAGFTWNDLLDRWGIVEQKRFSLLALLGVMACCVCAIARALRNPSDRDEEE